MRRIDRSHSEVVLNLAEITDRKRVKNRQILVIHVVDLVLGIARNEQHSSGLDAMHHILNGDCAAS